MSINSPIADIKDFRKTLPSYFLDICLFYMDSNKSKLTAVFKSLFILVVDDKKY